MDKLTLVNTRDLPMTTNTLAFMQAAYAIFEQLGYLGGDNIIVSGCVVTGSSVSAGYMFLKGKLMPFNGGTIQTNVKIVTVVTDVPVDAGVRQQTSYRAEFGTSTNSEENVPWNSIVRIDSNKALMTQIADILDQIEQLDTDILANAVDIQANADAIAALAQDEIDWVSGTIISGSIDSAQSKIRASKVGKIVYLTGTLKLNGGLSEDTILFQLPGTFPVFTETMYFASCDGNSDENNEMKALSGTRNIVMGGGHSTNTTGYFSVAIPIL